MIDALQGKKWSAGNCSLKLLSEKFCATKEALYWDI